MIVVPEFAPLVAEKSQVLPDRHLAGKFIFCCSLAKILLSYVQPDHFRFQCSGFNVQQLCGPLLFRGQQHFMLVLILRFLFLKYRLIAVVNRTPETDCVIQAFVDFVIACLWRC